MAHGETTPRIKLEVPHAVPCSASGGLVPLLGRCWANQNRPPADRAHTYSPYDAVDIARAALPLAGPCYHRPKSLHVCGLREHPIPEAGHRLAWLEKRLGGLGKAAVFLPVFPLPLPLTCSPARLLSNSLGFNFNLAPTALRPQPQVSVAASLSSTLTLPLLHSFTPSLLRRIKYHLHR